MPADFVIRPFDPVADGPALHAIFGDEESCRYLARPAMASVADTIAMMQQWIGKDDISWTLADHPGGSAIGRVAIYPRGRNIWDAACMIVPAARGRLLAPRALALALDEAFATLGARRIIADIDPDNAASIRVFEKLRFRPEARLRGEWETHIGVRGSLIFDLMRDDPRPWRNWPS
ncbi:MAG: GNAT family N-acetyltransferase [Hyphomonadaceae bacterium]